MVLRNNTNKQHIHMILMRNSRELHSGSQRATKTAH